MNTWEMTHDMAEEATRRVVYCDRDRDQEFIKLAESFIFRKLSERSWVNSSAGSKTGDESMAMMIRNAKPGDNYECMRMAKLVLHSPKLPAFIYVMKLDCARELYLRLAAVAAYAHIDSPHTFYRISISCTNSPLHHEANMITGDRLAAASKWSAALYDEPRLASAYGQCLLAHAHRTGLRALGDGSESSDGSNSMEDDDTDLGMDASSGMSTAESTEHWLMPVPSGMDQLRTLLVQNASMPTKPRAQRNSWLHFGSKTAMRHLYEPLRHQHAPIVRTLLIVYFYCVYQCSELLIKPTPKGNRDEYLLRIMRYGVEWITSEADKSSRREHLPQRPCDISIELVFSVYEAAIRLGLAMIQGKIVGDQVDAAIVALLHSSFAYISKDRLIASLRRICNLFSVLRSAQAADSVMVAQRLAVTATGHDPVVVALINDLFHSHMIIRAQQVVRIGHRILSHHSFRETIASSSSGEGMRLATSWRCFMQQKIILYLKHTYSDDELVTLRFIEDPVPTPLELRATVTSSIPELRDGLDYVIVWSPMHVHRETAVVLQRRHFHLLCGGELVRCLARQQRLDSYWFPQRNTLYAGARVARAFLDNAYTGYHMQALAIICRVRITSTVHFCEGDEVQAAFNRLLLLLTRLVAGAKTKARLALVDAVCEACEKGDGEPLWTVLETALTSCATDVVYSVPRNKRPIPDRPPANLPSRNEELWANMFGAAKTRPTAQIVDAKRRKLNDPDYDCDSECSDEEEQRWQEEDRRRDREVQEALRQEASGRSGAAFRNVRRRRGQLFVGNALRTRTGNYYALRRGELQRDGGKSHLLLLDSLLVCRPPMPLRVMAQIRAVIVKKTNVDDELHSIPLPAISPAGDRDKWNSNGIVDIGSPLATIADDVNLCAVLACAMDCIPGLYRNSGKDPSSWPLLRECAHHYVDYLLDEARRTDTIYTPVARSPIIGTVPESYSTTRFSSIERIALLTELSRENRGEGGVPRPFTDAYPCCMEAVFTNFYWISTQCAGVL